jgi:predicted nucleic acid-binding protein
MIVVDSSVWIARLRNASTSQTRAFDDIEDFGTVILGDIVLMELLLGVNDDRHAANIQKKLSTFAVVPFLTPDLAIKAAKNYRMLRSRGITIRKTVDLIIGTYCIEHGHQLLHADRDFVPMIEHLGLQVL